jgi:hypothetical protein
MAGTSEKWAGYAGRHMKAELKRAGIGYAELARRLTEMEIPETDTSVSAKINRGVFPAWFLFAVMRAIGRDVVRLDDL